MNIKIINGYLIVDGICRVSATYKVFTDEGIDICIPKVKQMEPASVSDYSLPAEPSTLSNVATIGDVHNTVVELLESLAKRFETMDPHTPCLQRMPHEIRTEKENWK